MSHSFHRPHSLRSDGVVQVWPLVLTAFDHIFLNAVQTACNYQIQKLYVLLYVKA